MFIMFDPDITSKYLQREDLIVKIPRKWLAVLETVLPMQVIANNVFCFEFFWFFNFFFLFLYGFNK